MRINMVIVSDDNANVCVRPQSHWQEHNITNTNQLAIYSLSCRGSVTSVTQTAKGEYLPSY